MQNSVNFLKTLEIELPYGPPIPLLSIYPKTMKTLTQKVTCIFTVTLVYNSEAMEAN